MRRRTRGNPVPTCIALAALVGACSSAACSFDEGGIFGDRDASSSDGRFDASGFGDARPDASSSRPDAAGESPGVLVSVATEEEPSLNGLTDDWEAARWRSFDIADAPEYWVRHQAYTNSAKVDFASMHDATNIYFFFAVSDDHLQSDSLEIWRDDAITIFLDAAGDRAGPIGYDDHEIAIGEDNTYVDYGVSRGASDITLGGIVVSGGGGYQIEIRIRKDTLGADPLPGVLGFTISISDDDDLGDHSVDCYAPWYTAPGPHCSECCGGDPPYPWCDTTTLGQLVLQ